MNDLVLTEWGDRYIVTDGATKERLGTIALFHAAGMTAWRLYDSRHALVGLTPAPAEPMDAANHLRIIVTGATE